MVGGPALGLLLDRVGRPGWLLAGALGLYGGGLGLVLLGLGRVPFAAVLGLAVVAGVAGPAVAGGWTAQLPRVVPGAVLGRANVLDAMTFGTAGLAGPALAGGVAEEVGAAGAVAVAGALIGVAVPVAWGLPGAPGRGVARGGFAAGARLVLRNSALARATFTSVGCCRARRGRGWWPTPCWPVWWWRRTR
ncbi:hypothetical protein ACPCI1_27185 [Streptomyces seoulensis]|uniref:hypothetical protein n=1 Tax=Streptomyces seoulensis TaxID=73044 RepID=UPI003C2F39AD